MLIRFTEEQATLMNKIGVPFDITKDLTDDEICDLVDYAADHLNLHCLDDDYAPNHEGVVCYQVLDILGKL